MKLHTDNHGFQGIVPTERIPFKIATNAKMFGILSDGIYKDKILAVIRELSCNAFDAHYVAGQSSPFKVQVPTYLEPTFAVIDEGTGIDPTKIADIFWTYGTSSKTECNNQIGALGLGSKSPFAYTKSSFIVKNRYNGKEHTYFCFINEQGMPDGSEVSVEDTDVHSGITVELAVRREDVLAFKSRITEFFQYWKPENRPSFINGSDITFKVTDKVFGKNNWYLTQHTKYEFGGKALMGGILYPINIKSIPAASYDLRFVATNNFVIDFPIGDLAFQVSREELSYEKLTIDSLEAMAGKVVSEFKDHIKAEIEKGADTPYNLYRNYHQINNTLKRLQLRSFDGNCIITNPVNEFFNVRNTETFSTTKGESFNLTELTNHSKTFMFAGYSSLNILTVETNGTNKTNKSFRYILKSNREVLFELGAEGAYKPWFRPNIKPSPSIGRTLKAKSPSEMLGDGFLVTQTKIIVNSPKSLGDGGQKDLIFVLNDKGLTEGTKLYREYLNSFNHNHFGCYFVTAEDKRSDHGRQEIETMLKGSIFEGCPIILLSEIEEVGDLLKVLVTPSVEKVKEAVSVKYLKFKYRGLNGNPHINTYNHYSPSRKLFSERFNTPSVGYYGESKQTIDIISNFSGLYLINNKTKDTEKTLFGYGEHQLGWLLNSGVFDACAQSIDGNAKELKLYVLTETVAARLIKNGAQLKTVQSVIKEYLESSDYISRMSKYTNLINHESNVAWFNYSFCDKGYSSISKILDGVTSANSLFKTTINSIEGIKKDLKENPQLVHDIMLTKMLGGYIMDTSTSPPSNGDCPVTRLLTQYPLIDMLTRGFENINSLVDTPEYRGVLVNEIVDYINLKDGSMKLVTNKNKKV